MTILRALFPVHRSAAHSARRCESRRQRAQRLGRQPSLAPERLEPRALLAVTAALNGGDLEIFYNAAGDLTASISSDGVDYTVSGTGLADTSFAIADVTGRIVVADKAAQAGQQFTVQAGTALENPLQVNATVENAELIGGIAPLVPGDVFIGSGAITLASDVDTSVTNANITFSGAVTLANVVLLDTGVDAGGITFFSTLDGGFALGVSAGVGDIIFTDAVGAVEPLAGLTILSAATTTFQSTLVLDGTVGGADPAGLVIGDAVNNVTLDTVGSVIYGFVDDGIHFVGGSTGTTIANVTIIANGGSGIRFDAGTYTGTVVRSNQILGNEGPGVVLDAAFGTLADLVFGGDAVVGEGNSIFANKSDGMLVLAGDYAGTAIEGNTIGSPEQAFQIAAGGTQVTISGTEVFDVLIVGQAVALRPTAPTTAAWAVRTITAVNEVGGNTVVTLSSPIDATTTAGVAVIGNLGRGIFLDASDDAITNLTIGGLVGLGTKYGNEVHANTLDGIYVGSGTYTGTLIGEGNTIVLNLLNGIQLEGGQVLDLFIAGNEIGAAQGKGNAGGGIKANAGDYLGSAIFGNTLTANKFGLVLAGTPTADGVQNLEVIDNAIEASTQNGLTATGDLTGTTVSGNTIGNTGTRGSHASVALVNARNLAFGELGAGNTVTGGTGAGVYTTGDLTGTTVRANSFLQTRAGIVLDNARNVAFGGVADGEGNTIVGGGDLSKRQYRDGVFTLGDLTGSTVAGTVVENCWIGVSLNSSRGLTASATIVTDQQGIGLYAAGSTVGTTVTGLSVVRTEAPTIDTCGGVIVGAAGLVLTDSEFEGDTTALFVFNASLGTVIKDSWFSGLITSVGLFNATSLAFGQSGQGNEIAVVQTGLYASGDFPGTTVGYSTFTGSRAGTTAWALSSATGLTLQFNTVRSSSVGLYASGSGTGTRIVSNQFDGSINGVMLSSARGLTLNTNTISNSTGIGLVGNGICTGSSVLSTTWRSNARNVSNTAQGLTISPSAP